MPSQWSRQLRNENKHATAATPIANAAGRVDVAGLHANCAEAPLSSGKHGDEVVPVGTVRVALLEPLQSLVSYKVNRPPAPQLSPVNCMEPLALPAEHVAPTLLNLSSIVGVPEQPAPLYNLKSTVVARALPKHRATKSSFIMFCWRWFVMLIRTLTAN